jgi:hypothetical protein
MNAALFLIVALQLTDSGATQVVDGPQLDTIAAAPLVAPMRAGIVIAADSVPSSDTLTPSDTLRRRPRAIEYSDAYYKRLTIHRVGSYAMLPLFATEYALGQRLLTGTYPPKWVRSAHGVVAGGLGVLFTVNTVTGAWNLWDARHDENDRTRRFLHTGLMLASDAGFVWAGSIGEDANESPGGARQHRNVAVGSMVLSTAGTAMMWLWKD